MSLKLIAPSKARVINGEGINLQHFLPKQTQESQFSFLFIGRLLTDKGIREYVDAATVLKKKYPQINFNILGPLNSNNPTAITPEELQNWTETGYVTYLGETNNVIPFIEQASCIVLPSYREGISRVLLEASAMQCPIVTTNTTGCRDIVTDGINGLLCEPKDTLSLTQAMEKMLLLPELERQAMGKKGREIVLNTFDQKIITDIYLDTLK